MPIFKVRATCTVQYDAHIEASNAEQAKERGHALLNAIGLDTFRDVDCFTEIDSEEPPELLEQKEGNFIRVDYEDSEFDGIKLK